MAQLYIFDFDDTLFDTYGFYADVLVRLNKLHGLKTDLFSAGVGELETKKLGKYDFYGHLRQHLEISRAQLRHQLVDQLPQKSYVFPDAAKILTRLKERSVELVILTVGTPTWQRTKFDHAPEIAGIKRKVINQSKGQFLASMIMSKEDHLLPTRFRLSDYDSKILVDDSLGNFTGLSGLKDFELVRIRRPGAKHAGPETPAGVREIVSLDQI